MYKITLTNGLTGHMTTVRTSAPCEQKALRKILCNNISNGLTVVRVEKI